LVGWLVGLLWELLKKVFQKIRSSPDDLYRLCAHILRVIPNNNAILFRGNRNI